MSIRRRYKNIWFIFETKNYKLLQTIKIFNIYGATLELSNGNIISSNFGSTLIILNNIYSNSNINEIYQIQAYITFAKRQIECIIETTNNEIYCSSTYDELIGFYNKKTLKCTSKIEYDINWDNALCMIN